MHGWMDGWIDGKALCLQSQKHPPKMRRCGCQVFQVDTLEGIVVSVGSEPLTKRVSVKLLTPIYHSG